MKSLIVKMTLFVAVLQIFSQSSFAAYELTPADEIDGGFYYPSVSSLLSKNTPILRRELIGFGALGRLEQRNISDHVDAFLREALDARALAPADHDRASQRLLADPDLQLGSIQEAIRQNARARADVAPAHGNIAHAPQRAAPVPPATVGVPAPARHQIPAAAMPAAQAALVARIMVLKPEWRGREAALGQRSEAALKAVLVQLERGIDLEAIRNAR